MTELTVPEACQKIVYDIPSLAISEEPSWQRRKLMLFDKFDPLAARSCTEFGETVIDLLLAWQTRSIKQLIDRYYELTRKILCYESSPQRYRAEEPYRETIEDLDSKRHQVHLQIQSAITEEVLSLRKKHKVGKNEPVDQERVVEFSKLLIKGAKLHSEIWISQIPAGWKLVVENEHGVEVQQSSYTSDWHARGRECSMALIHFDPEVLGRSEIRYRLVPDLGETKALDQENLHYLENLIGKPACQFLEERGITIQRNLSQEKKYRCTVFDFRFQGVQIMLRQLDRVYAFFLAPLEAPATAKIDDDRRRIDGIHMLLRPYEYQERERDFQGQSYSGEFLEFFVSWLESIESKYPVFLKFSNVKKAEPCLAKLRSALEGKKTPKLYNFC